MSNRTRMAALAAAVLTMQAATLVAADQRAFGRMQKGGELIGKEVQNKQGEKIGKIADVIVDLESGRVLYTLLSAGGFLGIGDTLTPVPPGLFSADQNVYTVNAEKQTMLNGPRFTREHEEQLGRVDFVQQTYRHYNQQTWWGERQAQASFGNVHRASKLNGRNVKNVADQPLGEVEDVTIDLASGRVGFVLIDPTDTTDNVPRAVPPNALTLSADGKMLVLDADKTKLEAAPKLDRNQQLSDPVFAANVYQYYGKQPFWSGSAALTAPERRERETASGRERSREERLEARQTNRPRAGREGFGQVWAAKRLIGNEIKTSDGQQIGKLDDIVVDLESGRVLYTLIADNRLLAGKEGRRAFPAEIFSDVSGDDPLVVNANAQKLANAPRLTKERQAELGRTIFATEVYRHFNQRMWWDGTPASNGPEARTQSAQRDRFGHVRLGSELNGMKVENSAGENLGEVEQALVDLPNGRIPYLLLDAPGSELGDNFLPIPSMAFTASADKKVLVVGFDKEQLRNAPRIQRGERERLNDPNFVGQVYQHYGKKPYWNTTLSPTGQQRDR